MSDQYRPGDHLSVSYGHYKHCGLYCGDDTVIHLSKEIGVVAKTTLTAFANGQRVSVEPIEASYSPDAAVQRAESQLGKKGYHLVTHNCEHFVNWCRTGIAKSQQVLKFLGIQLSTSSTDSIAHDVPTPALTQTESKQPSFLEKIKQTFNKSDEDEQDYSRRKFEKRLANLQKTVDKLSRALAELNQNEKNDRELTLRHTC